MRASPEWRVTDLEKALERLAESQAKTEESLRTVNERMAASDALSRVDMQEFRDRMAASDARSRTEMQEFRDRMAASDARSRTEMQESKAEMREFHKKLGEMSNKFGTLVEDIVLPNLPGLFVQLFHEEPEIFSRVTKRKSSDRSQTREFDAVLSGETVILFVETKSALKPEDVPKWTGVLETARSYFPDAGEKKIFGALASFYLDNSLATYVDRQGIFIFALGGGFLEPKNSKEFSPRVF